MRYIEFDYFRAFAILLIIAGHVFIYIDINTYFEYFIINLLAGGTALFVFISGFFFQKIFYARFNYKKFMWKKINNVFFPYLILVSLAILWGWSTYGTPFGYSEVFGFGPDPSFIEKISLISLYYATGKPMLAYWYIPFIMVIFAASPLFISFVKKSLRLKICIFFLFLIVALLTHRSLGEMSIVQMVFYYTNIYLLGMMCGEYYDRLIVSLKPYKLHFSIIIIALAAYQAWGLNQFGNFEKDNIFSYSGIDIMLLQKIMMCFLFLSCASYLRTKSWPVVSHIAECSFALFFLHGWSIAILAPIFLSDYLHKILPEWGLGVLFFMAVTALSYGIAVLIKRVFANNSRRVIGW